jgi:hypothetical protein
MRYTNFINEIINNGKFVNANNEYVVERIKHLVDLVRPLLKEAYDLHPEVKKWKRCTKLTAELTDAWYKIFESPFKETNVDTTKDSELVVNKYYIYEPDVNVLPKYIQAYNRKMVRLVKIGDNKHTQYTDSKTKAKECIYQVEYFFPYQGKYYFWTRKDCLKKVDKNGRS